jgi:hypothetical protein
MAHAHVAIAILLSGSAARAQSPAAPPLALAGAQAMRLQVVDLPNTSAEVLDPASSLWERAPSTPLILNRTPRLFQTETLDQPAPPSAEARAVRAESKLLIRLSWSDPSHDAPRAPDARKGEAGVPDLIYKRPTGETAAFSDAAAVMMPENWTGPAFPSLVMGDEKSPAMLYHWTASRGAEVLRARGRATTTRLDQTFPAKAIHDEGRWTVTLQVPAPSVETGYPVAFAIWDGQHGDRDGLKFFSVWYVLTTRPLTSGPGRGDRNP